MSGSHSVEWKRPNTKSFGLYDSLYWVGQKFVVFCKMALVALSCLTSFKPILLDCIVTVVISACIEKNLIKFGEFLCSHFNTQDGRK